MNIKNLINPELLLEVKDNKIVLKEEQNENRANTLQEVIITELPEKTIAYSLDKRGIHNQYFNIGNVDYIDKRSDGVLISQHENQLHVLICDLKSTNFSPKDCSYKFMVDKLFLDYMIGILNTIFKQDLSISTIKYVVFYLKIGLQGGKPVMRITKENLQEKEIIKMIDFEDFIAKIPLSKTHKNYISYASLFS